MINLHMILLILALVCFLIAAIGKPSTAPINPIALGLAFWVIGAMIG